MDKYDVVIIGSGPAGYHSALRLSDAGLSVCLIEKEELGGVCLNRGCIPTKTLAHAANKINDINSFKNYGINISDYNFNFDVFKQKQKNVVERIKKGLEFSLKKSNVSIIFGIASVKEDGIINVRGKEISFDVKYDKLIIASGSKPVMFDSLLSSNVISSEAFWSMTNIPKDITIVGGGVIGCEYAASLSRLGFNLNLIEKEEKLLLTEEDEISAQVLQDLKKQGVNVNLGESLENIKESGLYILCLGRKICLDDFNIENILNKKNVWIVGDAACSPMLAHKAYYDADIAAREILSGKKIIKNYDNIPVSIFTIPEVSRVGFTEYEVSQKFNIEIKKISFAQIGKAVATDNTRGFVKFVLDKEKEEVLGISMYGNGVSEMINTAYFIVENKVKVKELRNIPFSHPTLSEIFKKV